MYSKMQRGIIDHEAYVGAANVDDFEDMTFVFLCLERPREKNDYRKVGDFWPPVRRCRDGRHLTEGSLGGVLRVTASTPTQRDHVRNRISFSENDGRNEYDVNIQIADLNALNAALAVIKWKKLVGFFHDLECEHHSTYTIDGNMLLNEDRQP